MGRRPAKKKHHRDVDGVLLLDKPLGMSSNQALQRLKHLMRAHKAGHTGSLDPLATGCLPLCFGEASKVSSYLLDADKHYDTVARLGLVTDTDDAEGEVIREAPVVLPDRAGLLSLLERFIGDQAQIPPMYSALHHEGQRLYNLARQGKTVELAPRHVHVSRLELVDVGDNTLSLSISCSKGTYIRSLVRDIGLALGCGAHVQALRRTGVDPFTTPQMISLDEAIDLADQGLLESKLLATDEVLINMPILALDEEQCARIKSGQKVTLDAAVDTGQELLRLYDPAGGFVGIGERDNLSLKAKRLMATGT
ncbi:unnamed protein product [Cyprideis torosa]|uniref:tRNA pseudouridine(55) synthase n=1 Tax=Cyprideis torosa TaxID=163714 RepID=A0A7R8WW05_9CRUS|nr:unnamed protein product [Cyprideis torosa]CAG0910077.1 unnamed protein product [Cyprideis torosa]